ncbi:hypothetical protein Vadar_020654 [Vaccinium darrowii]|uniref:Uncharacterized protein n=1 Tax=Vaccinium darrowii TaxID=229202 RepID=A0ACB7ZD60_9ERIC|nr:hypothetical protein Vadar_020654 [Vaccinium darrowii]
MDGSNLMGALSAMANMRSFKAFAVLFVVAIFSAAAATAQDLVPAPAPASGSAYSLPISGFIVCSSVALSLLAIMKH